MSVHGATAGSGFFFYGGVGIELGEEFLHVGQAKGKHECLIAVIAAAPVAGFEYFRHGELGYFFAIAKDAKFSFTGKHFFSPNERCMSALIGDFVVLNDLCNEILLR